MGMPVSNYTATDKTDRSPGTKRRYEKRDRTQSMKAKLAEEQAAEKKHRKKRLSDATCTICESLVHKELGREFGRGLL